MSHALTIASLELAARRSVFVTAAVLAVLPFPLLLLPEAGRVGSTAFLALSGAVIAAAYILALSLVLGATFVGRDLSERRLSFYFSKPFSAGSIWFGKLAAAVATMIIALAITLVPVLAVTGPEAASQQLAVDVAKLAGTFVLGSIVLLLLAHAISTMFRSRSLLIFGDLAAAAVVAFGMYAIVRALMAGDAVLVSMIFGGVFAAALLAALVGGGAWQLSRGRVDPRRNHLELSKFLWATVGMTLIVLGAATAWIVSAGLSDLFRIVDGTQASRSKWVFVEGPAARRGDYRAAFFVDLTSGTIVRADRSRRRSIEAFSRDGSAAVQVRRDEARAAGELELIRFGGDSVQVIPTLVAVEPGATVVLNANGTRAAVVSREELRVESLPDRRTLAVVRVPRSTRRLFFASDEVLRLYTQRDVAGATGFEIFEFAVAARRLTRTGSIEGDGGPLLFNASADGSKLLVRAATGTRPGPSRLRVCDARTGAELVTIASSVIRPEYGIILEDGRIATAGLTGGARTITLYSADGTPQRELRVRGSGRLPVFREVDGGRLLLGDWTRTYAVDLKTGAVTPAPAGLRVVEPDYYGYVRPDPRRFAARADAVALSGERALVRWNLSTGQTQLIAAP